MKQTLKVKANGTAMCPDFDAMEQGVHRFIGRRFDASMGADRPETKVLTPSADKTKKPAMVVIPKGKTGAWVPTDEVVEVPFRVEYVQEVQAGALLACDAETAKLCNVPFEV